MHQLACHPSLSGAPSAPPAREAAAVQVTGSAFGGAAVSALGSGVSKGFVSLVVVVDLLGLILVGLITAGCGNQV